MFTKLARCLDKKGVRLLNVSMKEQRASISVATNQEFTPISIDVPWGKVEAKLWGSTDKQPILAVHGWMDNAGTFDEIAPFLMKNSSILAIDLAGHGFSSWLPRGIPYTEDIHVMTLRRIVDKFGWSKVKLLGHSFGGILCHNYATSFPEETQFLVTIDSKAAVTDAGEWHYKRKALDMSKYVEFEKKITDNLPSYPEEMAIDKWIRGGVFQSLDIPVTKKLMIRGSLKKEDGTYYYTRDPSLRFMRILSCNTLEYVKIMTKHITCPVLVIKATNTPEHEDFEYWDTIAEISNEEGQNRLVVSVEGSHYAHITNSELVASYILQFLKNYDMLN